MSVDTIFALASGRLPSGVAVIRISGPGVRFGLETVCGRVTPPREMVLTHFVDALGETIDKGLVVYFQSPASFTGEDCAELHVHGGIASVRAMLNRLGELEGFRHAEAGEFTKRAFLSGKMDLTQAEGLADLISAETEAQRRSAIHQSSGTLRTIYEDWRQRLIRCRAMVEATIDFVDEDDVADRALISLKQELTTLATELSAHIVGYRSGEIIRDGYQVVIAGAPNVGKSSLLNALVKRDLAIATNVAGTTRDLIEVRLELDGNLVVLTDTAGLRESSDIVETIGIERAKARIVNCDLVLLVSDLSTSDADVFDFGVVPCIRVGTHSDVAGSRAAEVDFSLSTVTGEGISALLEELGSRVKNATSINAFVPTRERQVILLRRALAEIEFSNKLPTSQLDLIAEHLRVSTDELGRIVGRVDVEDLLDVIFSQFCIGK